MEARINRITHIDIFKGIGILFMVMGHIGFSSIFDKWIHAFHMPMFFFISGYLSKNISELHGGGREYILKKTKTLIVPYFSFGIFHFIFWYIAINKMQYHFGLLKNLLWTNTYTLPIAGALWFLTALFFVDIFYLLIEKFITYNSLKFFIILLISTFGTIETKVFSFRLPYAIDSAFVGIGLFYIGRLIKNHKEEKIICSLLNMKVLPIIISSFIVGILIFLNGYINMRSSKYAFIPLFWINALLSSIIILNISKFIENLFSHGIFKLIKSELTFVGSNSIVYVCLNQIVILLISHFTEILYPIRNEYLTKYSINILILIITMILLHLLTFLIKHTKLIIFIGKF